MISKETWNNVMTYQQRLKAIGLLYPDLTYDYKEEKAQKITSKLTESQKNILKALKPSKKSSRKFELSLTYEI